jgi:methionyl-tRNA formyltransferase
MKRIVIFGSNSIAKKCYNIIVKEKNLIVFLNPKSLVGNYYLGFSIKHNKIFKKKIIKKFEKGIINFHNGELPRFRGLYSIYHTIRLQHKLKIKYFYITIHFVNEKIDSGMIIKKFKVLLNKHETADSLYKKTEKKIIQIFKKMHKKLIWKSIDAKKQQGNSMYFNKNSINYFLDLNESKENIEAHIRALIFNKKEQAKIKIGNLNLKLIKS